jgi:hypothetical protein
MRQYAAGPPFLWQGSVPIPAYRHETLRDAHLALSYDYERYDSAAALIRGSLFKLGQTLNFLLGPLLVLPIVLLPVLMQSKIRYLYLSAAFFIAGMLLAVPFQPHYAAPITAVLYALTVQSLRYLWLLGRYGNPAGRILVPLMPMACIALLFTGSSPGMRDTGLRSRASIMSRLESTHEPHIVFVRYGSRHLLSDEWVYNEPDIDNAPIVWARDMGHEENLKLLRYFRNRTAILLRADENPPAIEPYRAPEIERAAEPVVRRPR